MFEKITSFPFSHLIRNKSIQNFAFLVTIQASNILISLISMPLLIQSIGVDQFGLVNLALSVIILANIVVDYGYSLSAPRAVALQSNDKEALSHIFSNIISSKMLLASLTSVVILISVFVFNLFQGYQTILILSMLILFSEAALPLWFFQGLEKMKLVSITNIFSKLLFLMGIVLFIQSPEQSKWVNFIFGGSALVINLCLLLYIHYELEIKLFKPRLKALVISFKENIFLFLSNLTSHFSVNGGLIILSFFSNAETLGMFSLAEKISFVLRMFPALVIQSIYPNASKLYQNDRPGFYRYLRKIYYTAIILSVIISMMTFLLAPFIVKVMTKQYLEESILYLKILSFIPFVACLNILNITILLVTDRKNLLFRLSWTMCIFMLVVSIVLGLNFGGTGLCFGLLAKELFVFFVGLVLIYKNEKAIFNGITSSLFGSHHHH
ncbi:hypothetical protein P872_08300 [Rhodonellum psychrophilum GCM71 = DSM 17998]|uniref:Polysaccharide biosynthesis protein C-terminal domain-containing protein n=2 Tax=Rhodonellum TaxID=336827 RepID=U5BZQ4_9BACT|nr:MULTISPECIES: oligosaccharide flippase family protein [Rhodonellum]ERM82161.1 hypothetical protein P872_08300 [Rhodonellum psychrophilum GCM71 = DSM 17998]SDY63199.1 polysaccharide transporter, PST family [Rhodonellum ikkaensis]